MTTELMKQAEDLEQQITSGNGDQRLALQPEFAQVLDRLSASGEPVPARLRRLGAALMDEAVEARFDNMPV